MAARLRSAIPDRSGRGLVLAAAVGGMVGALSVLAAGTYGGFWTHSTRIMETVLPTSPAVSLADAGGVQSAWGTIDAAVAPSVVALTVQSSEGTQTGSGVVFATLANGKSYVLTDRSTLQPAEQAEDLERIRVSFLSGTTATGRLVGDDPISHLAVVEVTSPDGNLAAATGSVADLTDADPVLAVAARPNGSISSGSVSGDDRTVALADGSDIDGLIAVSMPGLTSGGSGGPLMDQNGHVVGITLALNPTSPADQGLTFAVPIDEAVKVATQMINGQSVTHPWLGVRNASDLPPAMAQQLGIGGGVQAPLVVPGSPASRAGLAANDVVTSFEGQAVRTTGQLMAAVQTCSPGRSVKIGYVHAGVARTAWVTLATQPSGTG
jgi:putative serine protease PepD